MTIVALDTDAVLTGSDSWRTLVRTAIRDPAQLIERLGLPLALLDGIDTPHHQFRTFVPLPFLNRMVPGDSRDPLLLQVLPRKEEAASVAGFHDDAVGDLASELTPGLIQKYEGRALLIACGVCAVHCRYCFRRHFPYQSQRPVSIDQLNHALDSIRRDESIEEIILSGGDPLMMVDDKLAELIQLIESIQHIRRLRIHTRLPVVVPQRVTTSLLQILKSTRLATFLVLHVNHPQEIDDSVRKAAGQLNECQLTLLNQSVLLSGINDDLETLVELSKQLIEMNCLPYYLHQLDRVNGAAHFEVDQQVGEKFVDEMRNRLPGYAVPRFVRETAGHASKDLIR